MPATMPRPPLPRLARATRRALRVAIVGDVHAAWTPADTAALAFLAPDAALFVGDFGNEAVDVVAAVAAVEAATAIPVAVTLGNHDAWYCLTSRGAARRAASGRGTPVAAGRAATRAVEEQLTALGPAHVGWAHRAMPPARPDAPPLAVAGARPFSPGGPAFDSVAAFYEAEYGVPSFAAAAAKTRAALAGAAAWLADHPRAEDGAVILLAHNGPAGLGDAHHAPCGADFLPSAGDWGDPDTRAALAAAAGAGVQPPAVVAFGHMHRSLRGSARPRTAAAIDAATGTAYLNAAAWPRRASLPETRHDGVVTSRAATAHHALLVEITAGVATRADDVWVEVDARAGDNGKHGARVRSVSGLLRTETGRGAQGEILRSVFDGWENEWSAPVASAVPAGWFAED